MSVCVCVCVCVCFLTWASELGALSLGLFLLPMSLCLGVSASPHSQANHRRERDSFLPPHPTLPHPSHPSHPSLTLTHSLPPSLPSVVQTGQQVCHLCACGWENGSPLSRLISSHLTVCLVSSRHVFSSSPLGECEPTVSSHLTVCLILPCLF